MKNKVSSKDYQPIKFHRGRPHATPPGKTGQENDLNEDSKQKNREGTVNKDEAPHKEKERERENSYEEEDEKEKKKRTRF